MEELVSDQCVELPIAVFVGKSEAAKSERGRIQMFEPAARVRSQMQNERVVVIRNAAEHRRFSFDDLLHFVAQANRIIVALAVDHDPVRDAADLKVELPEVADFDGRVVKNIEVFGAKSIRLTFSLW